MRRDANATAINSADRIVKFERDRERERENVYAGHRCRRRCRRCLKRGFYSGSGTNPTARMVGIVALGQPDNHNWTGRFNEPHARRTPPRPRPTLGWSFNYSRYCRTLNHLPHHSDVTFLSTIVPPLSHLPPPIVHPIYTHRSVPFSTSSPARDSRAMTAAILSPPPLPE